MPPAARIADLHNCPATTGAVPHVGGPILGPGEPTVLIGNMPAAVVGDTCICVGPPSSISQGSGTVNIWRETGCANGRQHGPWRYYCHWVSNCNDWWIRVADYGE